MTLSFRLIEHNVPALYGIDTRKLTKKIRETGAILGKIQFDDQENVEFEDPNSRHLVKEVSTKEVRYFNVEKGSPRIIAYDCGIKYNIIRYFVHHLNVAFYLVPFDYDLEKNEKNIEYDGKSSIKIYL